MHQHAISCIVPPHILKNIATKGTESQKKLAISALTMSSQMRGQRQALSEFSSAAFRVAAGGKERLVYDARNGSKLPGVIARKENDPVSTDVAVNEAFDGSGATYDLFKNVYQRNSIDNSGMRLDSTVHYQIGYTNAFWNGEQIVYGDGDGDLPMHERLFNRFTLAIDVIAHELTHGVSQYPAKLGYAQQPGALNESMSDVFGSLVKQYSLNQTAAQADWIIGAGLFTSNVNGEGIRSMKAPGTAYDDPILGKDPQPARMKDYVNTVSDNGGVHINSGIPNHAFYITAMELGGYPWEKAGMIWYVTLRDKLTATSKFQDCANLTYGAAGELFGAGSPEQQAVKRGWAEVGFSVGEEPTAPNLWSLFGRTRQENIGEGQARAKMAERSEFPTSLPVDVVEAIENPQSDVRSRAVLQLANFLNGQDHDLAQAAKDALEKIVAEDDSFRVSQEAKQTLESFRQGEMRAAQNMASEQQTGEPAELSAEQITEREARLQAAIAANMLANNRSQPVFNDKAQGEDQLGIKDEVEALAETLLLRDVEPPVAVGVMGGWGSGKSFVMYLIHQYVQTTRAKQIKMGWPKDGQATDPKIPAFVGHVYQIHFNAWTYAKSNLWASLMDTIFSCLNRQMQLERLLAHRNFSPEDEPPSKEQIKESMMAGGEEFKKIYLDNLQLGQDKELEPCRRNLEHWSQHLLKGTLLWNVMRGQQVETLEKLKDTEEQLNQLKTRREQFEKERPLDQITTKSLKDETARHAYIQSIKSFMLAFLSDQLNATAKEELKKQDVKEEDVQKFLEEAKGLSGGVKTLVTAFRQSKIYLIWTVIFLIFFIAVPYLWSKYALDFIRPQIAQAISLTLTLLPTLRVIVPWIKKSMDASIEAKKILEGAYATQQAKHAEKIANAADKPIPQKISELQAEISNGSLPAYDALIGLLEAQAEEQRQKIGPSAKYSNLMEFVQSRLDAATYETQLGLMHQVRQDIDELTYSLVDNASPEYFPRGKPRVILYIDDLDRCPPSRVVEALEAVQLLLNTKLFIVILGLDTRYVTRALEKEYKEILQHEGDPSGLDYIEKIIQIPYRVRSIEKDGLRNYIEKQMDIEKVIEQTKSADTPPVEGEQESVQADFPAQPQPSDEIKGSPEPVFDEAIQGPSNGKEEPKEYAAEQSIETDIQRPELPVETKVEDPQPIESPKEQKPELQVELNVHRTEQPAEIIAQEPQPSEAPKEGEPEPPVESKTKEIEPPEFELSAEVIRFKQEDLEDLTVCCQKIALTPRSIKRLVNVFKLMKIFWFRADKNAGITDRDRPRPVKQAAMCLLALSSAYPEVMREVFVHLETLYGQGQQQTELFSALNNIKLPPGSASELSWQLQKYKADISALKIIAGNGQDNFGQLTLQNLKLSTFNIVRSFSFVGDPVYWTDDEDQISISNGPKPQPAKAKRNKNGK